MWKIISSLFFGGLDRILGTVGKTVTDIHTSNTARQGSENQAGVTVHGQQVEGHTAAGGQRADVQKSQGAWGPFGIAGFVIAMTFAFYTWLIVMDSTSWHISLTTRLWVIPWLEWTPHVVGSWKVARLPDDLWATYLKILEALFYVGPPSAAAIIAARAFRR